jgi:hypothetical protein
LGSIVQVISFVVQFALAVAGAPASASNAVNVGVAVVNLVLAFRVAEILRKALQRERLLLDVSSGAVFFFGSLYLQHKINQAAVAIDRLPASRTAASTTSASAVSAQSRTRQSESLKRIDARIVTATHLDREAQPARTRFGLG